MVTQSSGTLTLSNLQQGDEAWYKVRAFGRVNGVVESSPVQVVVNNPVAFAAGTGVTSLTLAEGDNSELRVNVLGFNPQIQWYRMAVGASDWVAVIGGTSSVLPLVGVVSQQAGSYGVVVHNDFSWAPVSRTPRVVARVVVNAAPVVTLSSGSHVALVSETALVLQAQVRDTTTLGRVSYVWRRNGKALPNSTGTAYVSSLQQTAVIECRVDSTGSADAGLYDVLVSNNYGAVLSDSARVTVNLKPTVVLQTKAIIASVGGVATFRVEASGSGDLSYQWWKRSISGGSSALSGETQKALQVSGVTLSDSGTAYWAVVSSDNGYGTATSAEGVLTVADEGSVSIGSEPSLVGASSTTLRSGSLNLRVAATATETSGAGSVSTRWRKNGVVVQTQEVTRGADGTFAFSYALPCTTNDSDGVYDVIVDNGVCFVTSAGLKLTVDPKIENFTVPALAKQGDGIKAIVSLSGISAGVYAFQWFKDGIQLSDDLIYSGANKAELVIRAVPKTWKGDIGFSVRVTNTTTGATQDSPVGNLTVIDPVEITRQPIATSIIEGDVLALVVNATGGGTLAYQWLKDGNELEGQSAASLMRTAASLEDGGVYQVRVSNLAGSVLSTIARVVVQPKFSVSLSALGAVPLGGAVSFASHVVGAGSATLSYVWTRNGIPLLGVVGEQYRVASLALIDGGSYAVTVTRKDTGTQVTSASVFLEVLKVPVIVVHPVARIVVNGAGAVVKFVVVARSEELMTYQWSKDGAPIPNATGASLVLASVTDANKGVYSVRISNTAGAVESGARLSVLPTGSATPSNPSAGSSDTGLARTSWWVYWASATPSLTASPSVGTVRNGYWLLERVNTSVNTSVGLTTIVVPGRALWIWGSSTNLTAPITSDEWSSSNQTVQDGVASDHSEFSVLADRVSSNYALSGRVENLGEAAQYGAPEIIRGNYVGDTSAEDVDLNWDATQVADLGSFGSPETLDALVEIVKATLLNELGSIAGE